MIRAVAEELDGVETVEASSGFEALRTLPSQPVNLIITDINMPDINGLELINFVKRDPKYKEIPLIIISTEKSDEDKRRGMAIGADGYLTKPFKSEELTAMIKKFLGL